MGSKSLQKVRLCTNVVLTSLKIHEQTLEMHEQEVKQALYALKQGLGNYWSITTAFQFMSGKKPELAIAELAIGYSNREEQLEIFFAHLVAKEISSRFDWSGADKPDNLDIAKLRRMAKEFIESNQNVDSNV